jgi:Uncharacterized protein conserved in bacteria (DUF2252)
MQPITQANEAYERWLRAQLDGDVVESDLREKREKMGKGPFQFLRATYWRWAEAIFEVCPDLAKAPPVLAVGDIHLENFGTWRDRDGRLVWGVNDVDEGAEMPYPLDLVRLATSALLARPGTGVEGKAICTAILEGYGKGLADPRPFVLEEKHAWLRDLVVLPEAERAEFWKKIDKLKRSGNGPAERYRRAIAGAMPERGIDIKFRPRSAGTGSLGRPRWVGLAEWRGGRVVREAKALVKSGWARAFGGGSQGHRCQELAFGRYRAPDPWYDVIDEIVVRRLSPNSRKIELDREPGDLLDPRMLRAMGHELANIHLGSGDRRAVVDRDLGERKSGWLRHAAAAAAECITAEHKEWLRGPARQVSREPTARQRR